MDSCNIKPWRTGYHRKPRWYVIAILLFLMPMYAINKVPAMRKYADKISNVFIVIMGLVAISAAIYKLFF